MGSELLEFLNYLRIECGFSQNTTQAYSSDLRKFLARSVNLKKVTKTQILDFIHTEFKDISERSIARKISAFKCFFEFALSNKWISQNPLSDLECPQFLQKLPQSLSENEIKQLLSTAQASKNLSVYPIVRLLYASGLRVSELTSLSLHQMDFQSAILRIQGKGNKVRIVPIDETTLKILSDYVQATRDRRMDKKSNQLFISSHNKPYTRQAIWKLLKQTALESGISKEKISPHVFRHTFATHLLENGMNLRILQALLGHSDISTTQVYSHISNQHLHTTVEKFHPKSTFCSMKLKK